MMVRIAIAYFIIEKRKLRHSLGRPSRSDFVQSEVVAYRKEDYQFKVLVKDRNKAEKQYANAIVGPATIEEIMLFYVKGEMQ